MRSNYRSAAAVYSRATFRSAQAFHSYKLKTNRMKINILKFTLAALVALPLFSYSQKLTCTTHSHTQEILKQHPERQALREQLERETQEYLALPENQRGGVVKVIPTVIHVIHDNGSENLSKQTILNALDYVNEELRGQNQNISSVVSAFENIVGDPQFELRLAKIDAWGNCTDGITRTQSDQTYAADNDVKDLVNWNDNTRRYLQVWLVNSVGSGSGGYTYLPGSNSAPNNGIILRSAQLQSSLAHEFGHWMNLDHTWGGTNTPEEPGNCWDDDQVSDTPNTVGISGSCNLNQQTCNSLDNVQNHMDYSSCARMFTAGQASRMQAASNSSVGGRNYYWGATNRANTGTNDGYTAPSCVPQVAFEFDDAVGCEGLQVDFDDNLWGADEDASWQWSWSFPGGSPSSSSDPNPTITYNTSGVYDVTLTITTNAGSNSLTIPDAVTVSSLGAGIYAQYQEGVESPNFPENTNPMLVWDVDAPDGFAWQRNTSAWFTGSASAVVDLRNGSEGGISNLTSPPIDMSDVESEDARMTFKLAHGNRTGTTHQERLRVHVSRNCGESWSLRYSEQGDDLNTAGSSLVGNSFVPNANQWREEEVNISLMAGEEHVLIRFQALSDKQSYLYIDDININPNHTVGIREIESLTGATVYPNPIDGTSQLELNLTEDGKFTFTLVDVLGKQLSGLTRNLNTGVNRISLNEFGENLNAGFYFIQINTESGQKTVRFVKN